MVEFYTDVNSEIAKHIQERTGEIVREMMRMVEEGSESALLDILRSRGYLILAPGDTSPLAQLVRAAVEVAQARTLPRGCLELAQLIDACDPVGYDPAVLEWAAVPAQDVGEVRCG